MNLDNNPLGNGGPGQGGNNQHRQSFFLLIVAALVTILCMSYFLRAMSGSETREITYSEFMKMLASGQVQSVTIDSDRILIYPKISEQSQRSMLGSLYSNLYGVGEMTADTYFTGKVEDDDTLTQRLLELGIEFQGDVPDNSGMIISPSSISIINILDG